MSLFISEHIMQSPASDKLKYIDLSFGKKNKNMSIPAVGEFFQGDQSWHLLTLHCMLDFLISTQLLMWRSELPRS